MNNVIAFNMKKLLIANNQTTLWYGDINLIEECANQLMLTKIHPKKNIQRILNALDRSDLFLKSYIYADLSGSMRKYRCFTLK